MGILEPTQSDTTYEILVARLPHSSSSGCAAPLENIYGQTYGFRISVGSGLSWIHSLRVPQHPMGDFPTDEASLAKLALPCPMSVQDAIR